MPIFVLAALAGLLQGIVEWLPVSSKTMITFVFVAGGYPFKVGYVMGLLANGGSFFAALWYFRRDILAALGALRHPLKTVEGTGRLRFIVLASLFTGIVGLPVYLGVISAFSNFTGGVVMLGIGALLLVTTYVNWRRERYAKEHRGQFVQGAPGPVTSIITGALQGLAALPGISRSALTVTPLLLRGHDAKQAIRYSFMLDVVALLAAGFVPLVLGHSGLRALHQVGVGPVAVMLVVAAVVSFFTIDGIIRLASRLRTSVVTLIVAVLTIAAGIAFGIR